MRDGIERLRLDGVDEAPCIAGGLCITAGGKSEPGSQSSGPHLAPAVPDSSRQWYLGLPPAVCGQTAGGKLSPVRDSACHITTGGPSYFPPALCDLSLAVLAQTAGGKFRPADHNLSPAKKTTNSRR